MKLVLGFTPFIDEDEGQGSDADLLVAKMEELMGPMPEPFRTKWKEEHRKKVKTRCFAAEVAKAEEEDEGTQLQAGWELENITEIPSPYPKAMLEQMKREEEAKRAERIKRGETLMSPGEESFRRNLRRPIYISVTKDEADDMMRQYELGKSRVRAQEQGLGDMVPLPFIQNPKLEYDEPSEEDDYSFEMQMPSQEADKLFDLLMSIFKWQPKDRATIQQVLEHPWFEGRNEHAAKVPPPAAADESEPSGLMKSFVSHRTIARLWSGKFS